MEQQAGEASGIKKLCEGPTLTNHTLLSIVRASKYVSLDRFRDLVLSFVYILE